MDGVFPFKLNTHAEKRQEIPIFFIGKYLRRKMEKDVFTADSKRYGGDATLCPK